VKVPVVHGVIRRRLLVNFRCEPEVIQAQLPARFRPKLHQGHAIAGICLIRLEAIRPHGLPALLGLSSENAAHRIAVTWQADDGQPQEGVYVPRRDTGSLLNHLAGGRVFPGEHHRAAFQIEEDSERIALAMQSADGDVAVRVKGRFGGDLPAGSCFGSLAEVSAFFERGALGYSATKTPGRLDGLTLHTRAWRVETLQADDVYSSFFADTKQFPAGTATFDCALAMRNIEHEWRSADDLHV
jgi:Uncharacterized conserved protein (COG2071)